MTTLSLESARIVGGLASTHSTAPFQRTSVVLRPTVGPERFVRVLRYSQHDAEGEELRSPEWRALIESGEGVEFESELRPGTWLWVFRSRFPLPTIEVLAELRQRGGLLSEIDVTGGKACVVVEPRVIPTRVALADRATLMALEALREENAGTAIPAAEAAFALDIQMTPRSVALLAFSHRRNGSDSRADGYLSMAEQTMGPLFLGRVREELLEIGREVCVVPERRFYKARVAAIRHAPLLHQGTA